MPAAFRASALTIDERVEERPRSRSDGPVGQSDPAFPGRRNAAGHPGDRSRRSGGRLLRTRGNPVPAGDRLGIDLGSRSHPASGGHGRSADAGGGRTPRALPRARHRPRPAVGTPRGDLRRRPRTGQPHGPLLMCRGSRAKASTPPPNTSSATASPTQGSTTARCPWDPAGCGT